MATSASPQQFRLVLLKPSHYDDAGYVIQWFRSAIPSNTLAVMNGLALDCRNRHVLGPEVEIVVDTIDEFNQRIHPRQLAERIGPRGLVAMVGVQSNQFPRVLDLCRPLRAAGVPVCIGGFHVSGCVAMLPQLPSELLEAQALGISLFAGEAEGRFEQVLRDAWQGTLKPLYNFMGQPPELPGAVAPILPAGHLNRNSGRMTSFDASRGCPFNCSFCTIVNVHGRHPRQRTADDVEQIVRQNLAQGINRFFIADDNFARNRNWEAIFDRLIHMREVEHLNLKFVLQVDTVAHRIPNFIAKAARAGVARVFVGMESIRQENLTAANKPQNKIGEYQQMLLEWKRSGVTVFAGYIIGFPGDTPETVTHDVALLKRDLPVDLVEFHCLTPLPGSRDHQQLYGSGLLDADLNRYDLEHVVTTHPIMTRAEWEQAYQDAWRSFYTIEHMKTIMRRAALTGSNPGNMVFLLAWYYLCFAVEKVDPLQGGYLRRKYRSDRRPGLPREAFGIFHLRYAADVVFKHVRLIGLVWELARYRRRLKRDLDGCRCADAALDEQPVVAG